MIEVSQLRKEQQAGSVSEAPTASDGIMDHKPLLVTWNQADNTRRQITKFSHFVEAGCSNNITGRETLERPTCLVRASTVV